MARLRYNGSPGARIMLPVITAAHLILGLLLIAQPASRLSSPAHLPGY